MKLFTVGLMKITALFLSAALSLSTAASALTLTPAQVYTLPGADTQFAAFLPGGRVAVNADNGILILDSKLRTTTGFYSLQGSIEGLAVSPDGTRVAAMNTRQWMVWDVATGREVRSGETAYDATLAFDAQGALLMLNDGTLTRLDLGTGRRSDLMGGGNLYSVAVSPDGTRAALAFEDRVQFMTLADRKVLAESPLTEEPGVLGASFSPDGQAVAVRTGSEALILRAGQEQAVSVDGGEDLDPQDDSLLFLSDTDLLAVSYGEAQRIDPQTGRASGEPFMLDADGPLVTGPGGELLTLGGQVARLDPQDLEAPATQANILPSSNAWTGAFVGNVPHAGLGRFLNLGSMQELKVGGSGRLDTFVAQANNIWTLRDLNVAVRRAGVTVNVATLDEDGEYGTLHASPDGTFAVASGYYGMALMNATTGKLIRKVTAKQLNVEDLHDALPTPDGKGIYVIPHEGNVFRYDVATGKQTLAFALPAGAEATEFQQSAGGTLAVVYVDDNDGRRVALLKPGATTAFKTLSFPDSVRALSFNPNGKQLAVLTGAAQNALQIFDTGTGALLTRTGQFNTSTGLLAWSQNGQQVMVGSGLLGKPGSVTVFNVK